MFSKVRFKRYQNYEKSPINSKFTIKRNMFYADNASIMSCIPKGEKPRQFLNNWRPITLLEVSTNVFLVV